jgi:hypothetical protein
MLVLILLTIAFLGLQGPDQAVAKSYASPDGKLQANVLPKGPAQESRVEIRDKQGILLASGDYSSGDGEHGQIVDEARWTPDSQFFVFSTYSSGGHQPWQTPTYFFDRRQNKIRDLGEFLPPVADSKFTLSAPDRITISIWTPFSREGIADSIILPVSFRLSDLHRAPQEPATGQDESGSEKPLL